MEYQLTLPALQTRLDSLHIAQSLTLANRQIEKLFGFNDVAIERMRRFARGHDCVVSYSDDCVTFLKGPASDKIVSQSRSTSPDVPNHSPETE